MIQQKQDNLKEDQPLLSIIIPVYNEENFIEKVLNKVLELPVSKEIIVVNDASTDKTAEILKKFEKNPVINIIHHEKNRGKGAAIRTGLSYVKGKIVAIQDADLEYEPKELLMLIRPILERDADVVYGSRFITTHERRVHLFWHYVVNNIITFISNMFTNLNLSDIETCYKVFKADIIKKITIEEDRFGFEAEITAKIAKIKGIKIYEMGISYHGRSYEEGKKIGWKDGIRTIYAIFKYNLFR